MEALSGIKAAVVARKYGISPNTVNQWVRDYRENNGEQDHPYPKIVDKYISQGNSATFVLRVVGLAVSTYYDRIKKLTQPKPCVNASSIGKRGRPTLGYSLTESEVKISDEQIKECLL